MNISEIRVELARHKISKFDFCMKTKISRFRLYSLEKGVSELSKEEMNKIILFFEEIKNTSNGG